MSALAPKSGLGADIWNSNAIRSGFSRYFGGLVKYRQPIPIAIYENVGAKVAATAYFTRFLAPTRFLDAMNPGDRAANVDLVHFHRNAELIERGPVASSGLIPRNREIRRRKRR
jgi:hypothetical protein